MEKVLDITLSETYPHVLEAERIQREIFKKMTPAQRYQQFKNLRETAWQIKRAGYKQQFPGETAEEIENRVRKCFLNATT